MWDKILAVLTTNMAGNMKYLKQIENKTRITAKKGVLILVASGSR